MRFGLFGYESFEAQYLKTTPKVIIVISFFMKLTIVS